MCEWIDPISNLERGNFVGSSDMMLALFSDPDARGSRRWREVFGFAPQPLRRSGGPVAEGAGGGAGGEDPGPGAVSVNEAPISSSGC